MNLIFYIYINMYKVNKYIKKVNKNFYEYRNRVKVETLYLKSFVSDT